MFDEHLLEWRDTQAPIDTPPMQEKLFTMPGDDWLMLLPVEPEKKPFKFVCSGCGGNVKKIVEFCGWEEVNIDPEDGDEINVVDKGRKNVHKVTYQCRAGCGDWTAAQLWYDLKMHEYRKEKEGHVALDIETPEPKKEGTDPLQRDLWPSFDHLFIRSDLLEGSVFRSPSWGSFWPSSGTSGNTD